MPDVVGLAADAVAQARSSRSMMVMDCRLLGQANSLMRFRGAGRYTPLSLDRRLATNRF